MALVIAHRGASADHPENTLEAFEAAAAQGADWVELDVRPSADGVLVVHHDAHLGDGRVVVEVPHAELDPHICTLAEALTTCAGAGLGVNIEIKCLPMDPDADRCIEVTDAVLALLEGLDPGAGRPQDLLITSFDPTTVARVRSHPGAPATGQLGVAFDGTGGPPLEAIVAAGHVAVNPWDPVATPELVDQAHDLGLAVNVWTVDDPERMAALVAMGVDGIITNVPSLARAVVAVPPVG